MFIIGWQGQRYRDVNEAREEWGGGRGQMLRPEPRPKDNCEAEARYYEAEAKARDVAWVIKIPYMITCAPTQK